MHEDQAAEEFAGGGVDDAHVELSDQQHDRPAGMSATDADVVEASGTSERDDSAGVDLVSTDPMVGAGA